MQHALKTLAESETPAPSPARPTVADRAHTYADFIAARISAASTTSVLRYSHRLQLLRAAPRFGLNRFEANLAIAAVMHRRRRRFDEEIPPANRSFVTGVTTFVVVQGALLLAAWWTLFH